MANATEIKRAIDDYYSSHLIIKSKIYPAKTVEIYVEYTLPNKNYGYFTFAAILLGMIGTLVGLILGIPKIYNYFNTKISN
ncbi:MAG: hypothetical protein DRN11_03575 [Thermoplasmata archaeon]|nr:MAG: hypothetical protein DRN11_03575 [Thermoplasmata archaeon]